MAPAKLATDLPLWPEAPFRARVAPRYEIRMGDWQGRKLAVVWDPEHQMQASGYLNDAGSWSDEDLVNVMNNLAGATFISKYGFEVMTETLKAKKVNYLVLSSEAKEMIRVYDSLYAWEATPLAGAALQAASEIMNEQPVPKDWPNVEAVKAAQELQT